MRTEKDRDTGCGVLRGRRLHELGALTGKALSVQGRPKPTFDFFKISF